MDPIQQLSAMRSQAQRAQLESWLGMQLPFDDEVLEYLLRLSQLVESEELSLLVADFCPHWPEGMQLALAASLSPQALRVRHGVPGSKQILLEPPARQERCEMPGRTIRGVEPGIRPKIKLLPEAPRKETPVEVITKAEPVPVDLQQTIKDIVQEQLALQQRLQRSISPKAGAMTQRPSSRCASPDAEAERRQKCTSYRPREQSIQEIINQQLLLQEQLRPLAEGGQDRDAGVMVTLDLPKTSVPSEGISEFKERMPDHRPIKDLSCTQETELGGGELQRCPTEDDSGVLSRAELRGEERRPAPRPTRHRKRSRPGHHISTGRLIDVAVKFPDGRTSWQRSAPEATTLDLKQRLARESGLDTEILRLTFLGLRLKDHWRLVDCGIRAHDKLQASYVGPHAFSCKDLGGRELGRQSAGPLPSLDDPFKEGVDASPTSPVQSLSESPKVEDAEPRWSAAVASLQHGIDALQETMKTSQQQQQENLADCRHSLSMLQQQQQHQLKALHFIEDQQRSLFKSAESSEMKEGLKQLQLEQQQLRARLSHLRQDLLDTRESPTVEMVQSSPRANRWAEEALSPVPVSPVSPGHEHRRWLILQVFRMLDRDRDGFLQQGELMGLARLMGFNFSEDEWRAEYQELCSDMEIQPQKGFDSISFTKLLDSEDGCPATDENLFEALINHCPDKRRATAAVELFERLDLDRDGFLSTGELRELPGMQGISLEGADHYDRFDLPAFHLLVAPLTVEQLQRAQNQQSPPVLQVDVVDVDVASAESPWAQSPSHPSPSHPSTTKSASPTSEVQESPAADARRNALMAQLFNALDSDGDGRCSSKDLGVVFAARYEAWPMHFRKLCSHWKVKQREGVDAQTFAEMLEDRSELGLYVSEDDLETMISDVVRQPRVERRVSIQDRSRLIDALFFYLDSNQDGLLDQMELQVLAKELKVEMRAEDFQGENALDLDAFREIVNDGGQCLYCDNSSLPSLLARFSRKG